MKINWMYSGLIKAMKTGLIIVIHPFDSSPELYNFAPLYGGDVAQVVEHRTENP
jgi:hypothetical protein